MKARGMLALIAVGAAWSQDPRELVRRSIAKDQLDWARMKDYTWRARSVERHFDSRGKVESTKEESWETVILDGQPFRRILDRDGKPPSAEAERRQQEKLDKAAAKLSSETPADKQRRLDETEKQRKSEFAFLSEIPDLLDLRLEGQSTVDGRHVWVISGSPRPGARPKSRDARVLVKIRGRIWIDQATEQWAKVEAESIDTISWGWFLARLNPGSRLTFEQTELNSELWLPRRLFLSGSGRVGLVKRLAEDQEIRWSDYKHFSVDSRVLTNAPPVPRD